MVSLFWPTSIPQLLPFSLKTRSAVVLYINVFFPESITRIYNWVVRGYLMSKQKCKLIVKEVWFATKQYNLETQIIKSVFYLYFKTTFWFFILTCTIFEARFLFFFQSRHLDSELALDKLGHDIDEHEAHDRHGEYFRSRDRIILTAVNICI